MPKPDPAKKYTHDKIRALLDKITPGEWRRVYRDWQDPGVIEANDHFIANPSPNAIDQHPDHLLDPAYVYADANFIAASPAIIRQLLAEIERLEAKMSGPPKPVGYIIRSSSVDAVLADGEGFLLCPVCGDQMQEQTPVHDSDGQWAVYTCENGHAYRRKLG